MEITKEKFNAYRKVQMSGKFNMFTEAYKYKDIIDCTLDEIFDIMVNYSKYVKIYGSNSIL